jgi:hypothetical protein
MLNPIKLMKAISEGNGSFGKLAVTLTSAIIVAGCFFWAASTFAQTSSVQSDATQSAQPDSIVQLTADAQGLPLLPPDAVPASGTFWLIMPGIDGGVTAPMPCPPKDTSFPIYQIANGQFLVDATGGEVAMNPQFAGQRIAASTVTDALELEASSVVNLITRIQTSEADQQTRATMQAMGMDVPSPGDGGTNSFTPDGASYIAPDYGTNLWIAQVTVLSGNLNGIGTNTQAGIQYDIFSRTNLLQTDWQYEGSIYGSGTTNWTPLTVSQNGRPILFLRLRSDVDDGSGLPIWWQLQYFGYVGVNPNAPDPVGDGWSNYQKFQMGLNPNVFYTPPTPQRLAASYNANNSSASVSWLPSPGPVTNYLVLKVDFQTGQNTYLNFPQGTTSFSDNLSGDTPYDPVGVGPTLFVYYQVQAQYAGGNSDWTDYAELESYFPIIYLVSDQQGNAYFAASALPPGTAALRLTRIDQLAEQNYGNSSFNVSNDIPLSVSTNGLYPIPAAWLTQPVDAYGFSDYGWWVQTVDAHGGATSEGISLGETYNYNSGTGWLVPPAFDGRVQLKQNLIFLLRAATANAPFGYSEYDTNHHFVATIANPTNYAYASFYGFNTYDMGTSTGDYIQYGPWLGATLPFENNYSYRNFVFNLSDMDSGGHIATGVSGDYLSTGGLKLQDPPSYQFPGPATTNIPALLGTNNTQWLASYALDSSPYYLSWIGITNNVPYYSMASNARNWFGLLFSSAKIAWGNNSGATTVLSAGGNTTSSGYFYPQTAQPQFQTVEYDFWQPQYYPMLDYLGNPTPNNFPIPGIPGFSTTNANRLLIMSVGSSINIAGYAKLAVTNGFNGVYGYLGQYFTNAYVIDTNGVVTTKTTGVLSSYGQFFATQPGPAALVTMPDPDTGAQGTCTVYAISLALDANHDGNMNLSFAGPDATSQSSPFDLWCDDNFDRLTLDEDDNTNYEDDVRIAYCPYTPNTPTPDCNYRDMYGNRVIPCTRDLEDYARLWVCGITSNLLAALPAGSTITLNWGDVGSPNAGNPTIDLFQATDADGGIEYLTNETSAANQINPAQSGYVGRLAPGGSVQLNASFFSGWAGNHFIWCGVTNGSGQLNLTIADASGNVLAQASQWIQIVDIKQMYERWTVGDNPTNTPATTASLATENLPVGASAFQYSSPQNTNTPYILFVHGWNMESWEKDRFAETAFKRLYWQGYQGRFGEFRWPTDYGFTGDFSQLLTNPQEKDNFDNSEYNAWLSGTGLLNKLNDLNAEYSGHVYVLAHSMGNIVTGTALRLAGATQVVNTYVASQAAVTAHTYDETVPNYSFDVTVGGVNFNLGPKTPNIYGDWFTNNNGGGAGQVISFYNTNDFALSQLHWQLDQLFKPDILVAESGSLWNYGYSGSTNDPAPWNHFFKTNTVSTTVNFDIVGSLANRYEVMSYAAQSYTTALGATPGVHHVAANVDLTTLWPSPDPLDNNYASHFYHSAEFRGDTVWEWNYWNTLLFSPSSGFNISSP